MSESKNKMDESLNINEEDEYNISIAKPNNSMEMEMEVEHLKYALSKNPEEKIKIHHEKPKINEVDMNHNKNKSPKTPDNCLRKNAKNLASNSEANGNIIIDKNINCKNPNVENLIERSKSKEIEIVKIAHSRPKSKSNDKDDESNKNPISQKYKKTNLIAAFGKLLNEKNFISELRKNFLKSLTKLNDNATKEIAFSELKDLISNYCTPEALRIYLNSLSTNYSTCTLAAKESQAVLIGFIASVFQENLIDSLDKPPSNLKSVARTCDILLSYLKLNSNVIHKACSYSLQQLYRYSMPKDDLNAIILIFIDPILPLVSSSANKLTQLGGAIALSNMIIHFGKDNIEILVKCHIKLINSLCKTKVENQFLVQALAELLRYLDIDYFMFYLKEIYERLINVLNNAKSNYFSRINGLECFKIIAKKLKNIDDDILGYHLTEIIFTLQNACKDRVHKVQLAAYSAIKEWREIEEICEKKLKQMKKENEKHINLFDKEVNIFKTEPDNFMGNNISPENYDQKKINIKNNLNKLTPKNKEVEPELLKGRMNKLNLLRKLSKLNKHESNENSKNNYNENKIKKNRNIDDFFKAHSENQIGKNSKSAERIDGKNKEKEETLKKEIGNALKLSNLLRNFQKENSNHPNFNLQKDFRSKSNPRAFNKISPPKNTLLESVANYLRNSRSANPKNKNAEEENDLMKAKFTYDNFYKNRLNNQNFIDEDDFLDYNIFNENDNKNNLDDNDLDKNLIFENEAVNNIERYEETKNGNLGHINNRPKKLGHQLDENNLKEENSSKNRNDRNNKFKIENEKEEHLNIIHENKRMVFKFFKEDIENLFSSFTRKMENFEKNINTKLDSLEGKIKKHKKEIKKIIKYKKSDSIRKEAKDKVIGIENKNDKNHAQVIKEDLKKHDEENELNNKDVERIHIKEKKQSFSNKASETSSRRDEDKLIKQESSKKLKKEANNKLTSIENVECNTNFKENEIIENLKNQIEYYKQKYLKQTFGWNKNNQDLVNSASTQFWVDILDKIHNNDYNSAYLKVLESEDDLFLLRLIYMTGPIFNNLKLDICKKLLIRTNLICRSHQIENILLIMVENAHQHYILNFLSKNEQNEILETLFEISKFNPSIIGNRATDLYSLINS